MKVLLAHHHQWHEQLPFNKLTSAGGKGVLLILWKSVTTSM